MERKQFLAEQTEPTRIKLVEVGGETMNTREAAQEEANKYLDEVDRLTPAMIQRWHLEGTGLDGNWTVEGVSKSTAEYVFEQYIQQLEKDVSRGARESEFIQERIDALTEARWVKGSSVGVGSDLKIFDDQDQVVWEEPIEQPEISDRIK